MGTAAKQSKVTVCDERFFMETIITSTFSPEEGIKFVISDFKLRVSLCRVNLCHKSPPSTAAFSAYSDLFLATPVADQSRLPFFYNPEIAVGFGGMKIFRGHGKRQEGVLSYFYRAFESRRDIGEHSRFIGEWKVKPAKPAGILKLEGSVLVNESPDGFGWGGFSFGHRGKV